MVHSKWNESWGFIRLITIPASERVGAGHRSLKKMITETKLKEYIWAEGDDDGYARSGRKGPIEDSDWRLIDEFISQITMIRRGLVSGSFREEHERRVGQEFDKKTTYEILKEYERKGDSRHRTSRSGWMLCCVTKWIKTD